MDLLAVTGDGKAKSFADVRDHALIRVLAEGLRRTEVTQMQMDDLPLDLVVQTVMRVVPLRGAVRVSLWPRSSTAVPGLTPSPRRPSARLPRPASPWNDGRGHA